MDQLRDIFRTLDGVQRRDPLTLKPGKHLVAGAPLCKALAHTLRTCIQIQLHCTIVLLHIRSQKHIMLATFVVRAFYASSSDLSRTTCIHRCTRSGVWHECGLPVRRLHLYSAVSRRQSKKGRHRCTSHALPRHVHARAQTH